MSFAGASRLWRRSLEALRAAIQAGTRQQITRAGLIFSITCTLVGFAAFASANNLLFLILAAMLSTLLISGLVSRLTLSGLEIELDLPEYISAGRRVAGRISIHNAKAWMPSFSVHVASQEIGSSGHGLLSPLYFPVLPGGQTVGATVELLFPRRGSYRDSKFLFSTRFPFGFAERKTPVHFRHDVIVYPSIDEPPGDEALMLSLFGELEARRQGLGHDFYRVRPYEVLESVRHVDWKATAHVRDLQVREFAREEDKMVEIYLDLDAGLEHLEWLERAIACCAFLVWRLSETDASFRFRTVDFDSTVPNDGAVHRVLRYLALTEGRPGKPLPLPDNASHYRVVFSPSPQHLAKSGWNLHDPQTHVVPM
ncbi:MAG TPA: DUF58 domain-containing protein [Bryobacteraceae bacterium]|jgi:uncharacterized protein (DUF58 family)|nr:DUF58 domain-containing protein [Bryobacteraceae bacterium]HVW09534.1 DUF58 domain-containing protein [Bryobacteraceae bacterium]